MQPGTPTTRLLLRIEGGDDTAFEELFPRVYEDLRAAARSYFRRQRVDHTLQPTALVHEVFVKMVRSTTTWKSRAHFLAVASRAMRQILSDHGRDRRAQKRGSGRGRVTLHEALTPSLGQDADLVALSDALDVLSELHPRQGRVVEMRFFGGMTIKETAHVIGVSTFTVEEDWRTARAWLSVQLSAIDEP